MEKIKKNFGFGFMRLPMKDGEIDTGINLTTLPYILVFAGVIVIAGAAFITRRRKYED